MCENCPNLQNYGVYKTIAFPISIMKAIEDAQFSQKFKVNKENLENFL